jgi:hypothetical protein
LQQQIWGKDTFVDFEQSLNKAVNRLREALNDEAGQPRYVETVPRRGYRFIAPVTGLNSTEPPGLPALPSLGSGAKPVTPGPRKARISTIAAFATATLLVGVGISAALWWRRPDRSTLADAKRITSAAFCCSTLSRDGKLLAYASGIAGGVMHIWVQQTAGGEAIQVTRGSDYDVSPDFSPDGTRIAFASTRGGGGIYLVPAFSGEPKRLTPSVNSLFVGDPVIRGVERHELVDVGAGCECFAGASKNCNAHGRVCGDRSASRSELIVHSHCHGVVCLRPVKHDRGDSIGFREMHRSLTHGAKAPAARSFCSASGPIPISARTSSV